MKFQGQKKLTSERIDRDMKIKALKEAGFTYQEIAERYRLHSTTIYNICKGEINEKING